MYSRDNFENDKKLLNTAYNSLINKYHVKKENIWQYAVPEVSDFPYTVHHLINYGKSEGKQFDAVICIGTIIENNITKDALQYLTDSISYRITKIGIKTDTPVIPGIFIDHENNIKDMCINTFGNSKADKMVEKAIEMARVRSFTKSKIFK